MMIKLVRNQILLWFSLFLVFLIINTTTTSLAEINPIIHSCNNPGNYTTNSTYEKNLNTTLSILPTTNNGFGFYNHSTGQGNNTVYSISLCRGDINPDICLSCLNNAIGNIRQLCSYKIDAHVYYEYCSFIYDHTTLLGNADPWYSMSIAESQNITINVDSFNAALRPLLYELRDQASNGGPLKKFACGNTAGPGFTNIYALVQCTPDLSKQECYGCLEDLFNQIPKYLTGKVGGRIVVHMCNLQYDMKLFFNVSGIALVIPPPPGPPPGIENYEHDIIRIYCKAESSL
ncbi:cysteine-rich receptor-like protein kinase 26 [Tanacetum coccineum]